MKTETGIELIAKERLEQVLKHNQTIEVDVKENGSYQLAIAASKMLAYPAECHDYQLPPVGWDINRYRKMREKSYKDRLIIAGALLAAELDRLIYHEKNPRQPL